MKLMDNQKQNSSLSLISYHEEIACLEEIKHSCLKGGNHMTSMQVEYSKLKETQQHNRAMEAQAQRELAETSQHNRATEQETASHNRISEALQSESNAVSLRVGELRAASAVTAAEIKAMTDLEKQKLVNDNQLALKNLDLGYQEYRDKLDRQIEKIKVEAQSKLNDANRTKVMAEIDKLTKETSAMDKQVANDSKRADAALSQAEAALSQAQTAKDNLEEQKYMNEYTIDWKEAELALKKQQNIRQWVDTTTGTITRIASLVPGVGGEDAHTINAMGNEVYP